MPPEINDSQPLNKAPALMADPDAWGDSFTAPLPKAQLGAQPLAQLKDWTMAIGLTESGPPDQSNPHGAGVDRQLPVLKQLAKETEGKSVNFIVHAERPVDDRMKPCDQGRVGVGASRDVGAAENVNETASCVLHALDNKEIVTERYFIHDGKIEKLSDANYKNAAEDLTALVNETGVLAPSTRLGLVVDSHGAGSEGIVTNLGPLSLDQTVGAIKTGLQSTGHIKLDLLDYDACDMGEIKVIDASSHVAKDVVASSALEGLTYTNDAQNIEATMHSLLANSKMTGCELGNTIVEQARTGTNGTGDNNATQILANFDLTIYDTFKQNLDRFGAALTAAAKNPGNLKQLQAEIDMTTIPDTAMPEAQSHDRDLKAFAQNVLADSRSHKLSGDTKTLETAAKSLIKSFDPLVTNQFGDKKKEYDQLGGLTASIPGSEILNGKRVAQEVTPLHEMSNQLKEVLDTNPPLSYKSRVTHYINHRINELPQQLVQQYQKQVKEMTEAQSGIERAQDLTAYRAALTRMQQVTSKIDSGPMGAQMAKGMKREAANEELGYLNSRIEQVAPEWDNFVGLMQEQMTPAD